MTFKLFFSKSSGFISTMMRFFIRSKYLSHTTGNFKIFEADMIMEASERGVGFSTAKFFADNNTIEAVVIPISGPLVSKEGVEEHLTWLIENYGDAKYDYLSAGDIGIKNRIHWLWKLIGKRLRKKLKKDKVQCTELWTRFLIHAGYEAVANVDPEMMDPLTLLKALSLFPNEFRIEKIEPGLQKEIDAFVSLKKKVSNDIAPLTQNIAKVEIKFLTGTRAGQVIQLPDTDKIRLGRHPNNDVAFDLQHDLDVSGHHAELRRQDNGYLLVDISNSTGVFCDGQRVAELLITGDKTISFGLNGPSIAIHFI